jgi:carboxyl-terminal processing protease
MKGRLRTIVLHTALVLGVLTLFAGFVQADNDLFFKINKSIDVFGRVYKEITLNYVDPVDPEKFMMAGVEGMLEMLDPYTTYIDRDEGDDVDLMTDGKYGGIGVTIGLRDGAMRVISIMEGYAAERSGLLPGDRFLEVDGVPVEEKSPSEVKHLTRGEPGTEVRLLIEREGEAEPLEFILIREEIRVKNVTYAGYVAPGIAYIKLERFSRQAGEEVRLAIKELKLTGTVEGIVLDVRGNPGGLLDAAVEVVSKFVPKGSLVVSTKGRRAEVAKEYRSVEEPLMAEVPMVVLTNQTSASASEIVAGGLQDLDRALIVGQRTFGKGLVQTIVPLNYGAQLKITTARYYTPSGRCIQEIDYQRRDENGVFLPSPDSLKREYKTAHGRPVFEHGGITPDSVVEARNLGPMVTALHRKSLFYKFLNTYLVQHPEDTLVTPGMVDAFGDFLKDEQFRFEDEATEQLGALRSAASSSRYSDAVMKELDTLEQMLEAEGDRGFERYRDCIALVLTVELRGRRFGERGRVEASLAGDPQLEAGIALLRDRRLYSRMTGG